MRFTFQKTTLAASLLLSISAISLPANADNAMLGTGGYARQLQKMEMMKMLDADGNHMVTTAEADDYYSSIFDKLDKNGDGSVDAKEWAGSSKNTKIDIATGGYSRELRSMKMMGAMDTDGDHKVTKEEFLAFHKTLFANKDKSGDQELSAQEWAAKIVGSN